MSHSVILRDNSSHKVIYIILEQIEKDIIFQLLQLLFPMTNQKLESLVYDVTYIEITIRKTFVSAHNLLFKVFFFFVSNTYTEKSCPGKTFHA